MVKRLPKRQRRQILKNRGSKRRDEMQERERERGGVHGHIHILVHKCKVLIKYTICNQLLEMYGSCCSRAWDGAQAQES